MLRHTPTLKLREERRHAERSRSPHPPCQECKLYLVVRSGSEWRLPQVDWAAGAPPVREHLGEHVAATCGEVRTDQANLAYSESAGLRYSFSHDERTEPPFLSATAILSRSTSPLPRTHAHFRVRVLELDVDLDLYQYLSSSLSLYPSIYR